MLDQQISSDMSEEGSWLCGYTSASTLQSGSDAKRNRSKRFFCDDGAPKEKAMGINPFMPRLLKMLGLITSPAVTAPVNARPLSAKH